MIPGPFPLGPRTIGRGLWAVNAGHGLTPRLYHPRIDPVDSAARPPVNDVHPASSAMLEHHAGRTAQIQFHDGLADRKPLQRRGGFGNDDRAVAGLVVLVVT